MIYVTLYMLQSRKRKEVWNMANYCEICGKKPVTGMNVSHSHLKTKRTWKPNIQRVRALVDGKVTRLNVCTVPSFGKS